MTFTIKQTTIRTIKQSDPKFNIVDGMVMAPRAGFEIGLGCPKEYKMIISECIGRGWLRPIANVKDTELFWEEFQK